MRPMPDEQTVKLPVVVQLPSAKAQDFCESTWVYDYSGRKPKKRLVTFSGTHPPGYAEKKLFERYFKESMGNVFSRVPFQK